MGSSGSTMHQPGSVFPLATIVVVLIFFLVGTLSCFFNRRRQRFLRRSLHPSDDGGDARRSAGITSTKIAPFDQDLEQGMFGTVAVIMPGKETPTYMAWPRPCQASCLPPPSPSPAIKFDAEDVPKSPPQDPPPVGAAPSLVDPNPFDQKLV